MGAPRRPVVNRRRSTGRCLTREELIEEHCCFEARKEIACFVRGLPYRRTPYEDLEPS